MFLRVALRGSEEVGAASKLKKRHVYKPGKINELKQPNYCFCGPNQRILTHSEKYFEDVLERSDDPEGFLSSDADEDIHHHHPQVFFCLLPCGSILSIRPSTHVQTISVLEILHLLYPMTHNLSSHQLFASRVLSLCHSDSFFFLKTLPHPSFFCLYAHVQPGRGWLMQHALDGQI